MRVLDSSGTRRVRPARTIGAVHEKLDAYKPRILRLDTAVSLVRLCYFGQVVRFDPCVGGGSMGEQCSSAVKL